MKLFSNNSSKNEKKKKTGKAKGAPPKSGGPPGRRRSQHASPGGAAARKRRSVMVAAGAIVFVFAVLAVSGFAVGSGKSIYPNLRVDGVDIGGMTVLEASGKLLDSGYEHAGQAVKVLLPMDRVLEISAQEAGVIGSSQQAAELAYQYGRGGHVFSNLFFYVKCLMGSVELSSEDSFELNEELVRARINEATGQVNAELVKSEITQDDEFIQLIKGASSAKVDPEEVYELVELAFRTKNYTTIEYELQAKEDAEIDLQGIYDSVFKEPVNAVYDKENDRVTDHTDGISFDLPRARDLWDAAKNGEKVLIPILITQPKITTQYLQSVLFADILSQKSTNLTYNGPRNTNITLSCKAINSFVMNPGDEFSYNATVGERTASAGYMGAGAYSNGKVVTEVGGGICQVSSTLYYTALYANLAITDRSCHYFTVSYLPLGLDATVSWPGPDFKFVNNRDFPIKIEAFTDLNNYTVTIRIYGTDVDGSYVNMTTEQWTTGTFIGAQSYRWVYDKNGNLLSKEPEARSQYHFQTEEDEEPDPTPTPSEIVSPSPSDTPSPTTSPTSSPPPTATVAPTSPPTDSPPPTDNPTPPVEPTVNPESPAPTVADASGSSG